MKINVRLWLPDDELMIYSNLKYNDYCIYFDSDKSIFEVEWFNPCIAKIEGGEVVESEGWQHIESIQMMGTGKQDIKGRDVYQGDIIKTVSGRICKIVWFDSPAFCGWDMIALNAVGFPPRGWRDLEVIGNAYENPEMI